MKNFHKNLKELFAFKRLIPLFIVISFNFQLFAPRPSSSNNCSDLAIVLEQPMLLPNLGEQSLYQILGVERDASDDQIKKARNKKALEWHSDKTKGVTAEQRERAEEMIRRINTAFTVLSDPVKRAAYDKGEYKETDAEKPEVVPYEKRFTGTKFEVDQKLYAVFKEVCRKNGFGWHETDSFRMFVCYLHLVQNDFNPDQFSLWLRKRANGVLFDTSATVMAECSVQEMRDYIQAEKEDDGLLNAAVLALTKSQREINYSRYHSREANGDYANEAQILRLKYPNEEDFKCAIDSDISSDGWKAKNRSDIIELRQRYLKKNEHKKKMDLITKQMCSNPEICSDAKFKDLPEGSKEQAIAEFLDALQNRRDCLSNPTAAIPIEIANMPNETIEQENARQKAINEFLTKNTDEQANIFMDNFMRTLPHKIGSLLSFLAGGGLLIFSVIKGAKGFYDMKNFNKAKRRVKKKMTPKIILKSIALPTGLGLGFLILRYFILYQKSQVKLSGGFDTTIDWTA